MRYWFATVLISTLVLVGAADAGEISGTVKVTSEVQKRAKNRNPNRKVTLKKYNGKAGFDKSNSKGGLPKNEKVDERDFVVVYLTSAKDGKKLKTTEKTIVVRQKKRRFFNHVTPVTLGSKVEFSNEDKFYHHIYCPDASNLCVEEHLDSVTRQPDELGSYELFCDIHPLMNAYVYVVPNDAFSLAKGGTFQIDSVPPGTYELKAWHPRLDTVTKEVVVPAEGSVKLDLSL